jgi:hypothetical protein
MRCKDQRTWKTMRQERSIQWLNIGMLSEEDEENGVDMIGNKGSELPDLIDIRLHL